MEGYKKREVVVAGTYIRETEKAFLIAQGDDEFWLPKSLMTYHQHHPQLDNRFECRVPLWMAEQDGLEYEER